MPLPPRRLSALLLLLLLAVAAPLRADVNPAALPQVSYQPGGIAYWDRPYFANALAPGTWVDQNWTSLPYWSSAQFDANGYPQSLQPGQTLIRVIINGLNAGYGSSPANFSSSFENPVTCLSFTSDDPSDKVMFSKPTAL